MADERTITDRYTLTRRIGSGGGGVVWEGRDETLGRRVAVKEVSLGPHMDESERERVRERTLREARSAAQLAHEDVVTIYDVLREEGSLYIVMEYVDAPSLREVIEERGPLPPEEVAALGLQITDVLGAAHDRGIIHRDIKPGNVLLRDDGSVKITDFGIAWIAGETSLTRTGESVGSPDYVSPEQAQGEEVGPAADLWSLGATLAYALNGEAPFHRNSAIATVRAVVDDHPSGLEEAGPLRSVLERVLVKDPDQRPSIDEARSMFRQAQEGGTATTVRLGGDQEEQTTVAIGEAEATTAVDEESPTPAGTTSGAPTGEVETHPTASPESPDVRTHDRRRDEADEVGRSRLPTAAAILGVLVAIILAVVVFQVLSTDSAGEPDPVALPATEAPDPDTATQQEAEEETEPSSPTLTEEATPTGDSGVVPDSWDSIEGPGFQVSAPAGWERRPASGNQFDLVDPETGAYLRVAWTDDPKPDPVADWQEQSEAFAETHDNYEEIRIEPVDYRETDAAIWEWTYSAEGQRFHAVNLGFTTGERGYALNFQTPASRWGEMSGLFETFQKAFEFQEG